MAILIEGMEMPKGCASCPFFDDECFGAYKCDAVQSWGSDTERASGCPLIPVPPHGRLIDADALKEHINNLSKPTTNADRIRSMADKELAKWYFDVFFKRTPYCSIHEDCPEHDDCELCLLEWLKMEGER